MKINEKVIEDFVDQIDEHSPKDVAIALQNARYCHENRKDVKDKMWSIIAKILFNDVNGLGYERTIAEKIGDEMQNEHPTLQQSFWRMIVELIEKYAKTEHFDGRNERAVKMCKEIMEHVDINLPLI